MKHFIMPAFATLALLAAGACGKKAETSSADADGDAALSEEATLSAETIASGTFEGRSEHITTGGVTISKDGDNYYVVLEENFSLDGAPDPKLGFGNGDYLVETQFSELRENTGGQTYKLPDGFDPTSYSQIYVWCEQFSVPLGVAALAPDS